MVLKKISILAFFLLTDLSSFSAQAGIFTKDSPKEIMADEKTEKLNFLLDKSFPDVMKKMRMMNVLCPGDRYQEAASDDSALIVYWQGSDTVSSILDVKVASEKTTSIVIYMNSNVSRQRRGWQLVLNEWFESASTRCIPEIIWGN